MYDARGGKSRADSSDSGVLFGVLTILVVAGAFFGVLMMPDMLGGKSDTSFAATEVQPGATKVTSALPDAATKRYVAALQRVSPEAAENLEASVSGALDGGAGKDQLAMLVLASYQTEMADAGQALANADVRHYDAFLKLGKQGLSRLSSSKSKWCKGTHYERFATKSQGEIMAEMMGLLRYDSPLYAYGLDWNVLTLEAIEDAQRNPVRHGKMTSADERAVEGLAMKFITDPQIMKLMTLQGASRSEMQRAVRGLDFCRLGVTALNAVESLPKETRARMFAEGFRQISKGDFTRQLSQFPGF